MMMDAVLHDTRLALRTLRRNAGFTFVVILTLALGIGATTAIFSVVNAVLLRPLPVADHEEVVMLWEYDRLTGTEREASSVPDYFDFRERNRSFRDLAAFSQGEMNFTRGDGEPRRVAAVSVTHNLGSLLGVTPQLGRPIQEQEDTPGGERVALVSDGFWSRGFGRDPAVIGRTLDLDDQPHTVIGVLAAGLDFPSRDADVWIPLQQGPTSTPRHRHRIRVVARLAPGTTVEAAQADMTAVAAELEREYSENRGRGVFVEPLSEVVRGEVRPALLVLFGAVVTVLLIACANVANLLLVRGASRTQEVAVAIALGAGVRQLARRHLVESLLLTGAAALAGVALAVAGLRAILAIAPPQVAALGEVGLDLRVLLFSLALAVAIGVFFGLVPTYQALRVDLRSALREGPRGAGAHGRERMHLRRLLVVAQTALALVLLVGAGLLIHSLWRLRQVDPGFRAESVLRLDYELPASRYPRDFSVWPRWSAVNNFNREILDRVAVLPGARSAALASNHPLDAGFTNSFVIVGREDEAVDQGELKTRMVSAGYFETAGVVLAAGRAFTNRDVADAPAVLLLNRAAVERYFPGGRAIGEKIRFWGTEREVIGIVANERMHGLGEATPPAMYVPLFQNPQVAGVTLMVRTSLPPRQLIAPTRAAVWALDRDLAVFNVATMDETLSQSLARERFVSILLVLFAAVAVILAAGGVHGVLSFLVARRRQEIGVRMALGANRRDVMRMVVWQGMAPALAGLVVGLAAALAATRLLAGLLYAVSPLDPLTYTAMTVVLLVAVLLACAVPARKATAVDPVAALRAE